eukprot:1178397-Prorocentrum_minimum.AAC.6
MARRGPPPHTNLRLLFARATRWTPDDNKPHAGGRWPAGASARATRSLPRAGRPPSPAPRGRSAPCGRRSRPYTLTAPPRSGPRSAPPPPSYSPGSPAPATDAIAKLQESHAYENPRVTIMKLQESQRTEADGAHGVLTSAAMFASRGGARRRRATLQREEGRG